MPESIIPAKTVEGQAEVAQRRRGLTQRQRTVLLLVDGRRPEPVVREMARQAGASDTAFDELLDLGLIERHAAPARGPGWATTTQPGGLGFATSTMPGALGAPVSTPTAARAPASAAAPAARVSTASPTASVPTAAATAGAESLVAAAVARVTQPGALGPLGDAGVSASAAFRDSAETPLAPSRTLPPESSLNDLDAAAGLELPEWLSQGARDEALEEARDLLIRAVRAQAPVVGSLTLLKLRRARSRGDLEGLLGEVGSRLLKPHRSLAAQQLLQRVRLLLAGTPI